MLLMMQKYKVASAALLAILIWSLAPALMKAQDASIPILYFLFLRYLLGSFIFIPGLKSLVKKLRHLPLPTLIGFTVFLIANHTLQFVAIRNLSVSWYVVLFALSPVLSLIFLRIPIDAKKIFWIGLAILGTLVFVLSNTLTQLPLLGLASLFASTLCWALITVFTKKIQAQLLDSEVAGLGHFLSLGVFFLLWALQGAPTIDLSLTSYFSIFLLGTGLSAAFILFSYALRHRPELAVISQYLEPVFGVIAGVIFFHEHLYWMQVLGGAMIVYGSARASSK